MSFNFSFFIVTLFNRIIENILHSISDAPPLFVLYRIILFLYVEH